MPRGLYVHIPFCLQKCHYCDFVITTKRAGSDRRSFIDSLKNEAKHAAHKYGRLDFQTLYFGGGTPSALSGEETAEILAALRGLFDLQPGCETTLEVNPGDVDAEKLLAFRDLGFNRISLGVQAFQDELLRDMGRPHTHAETLRTISLLLSAGFGNVSFDLIAGLPGQSVQQFRESLAGVVAHGASQLSLYDLDVHEKTVYGRRRRESRLPVPDEDRRAEMFALAVETMTGAGYAHYEISTFAKPGFESRHNLLYWKNQEYLGLGPGAYSYLGGVRYQFAPDVRAWLEKCGKCDWAPAQADHLTEEEKEKETLFTGLRLSEGVDLGNFKVIRDRVERKLKEPEARELFTREGTRVSMTLRGRFLAEKALAFILPEAERR